MELSIKLNNIVPPERIYSVSYKMGDRVGDLNTGFIDYGTTYCGDISGCTVTIVSGVTHPLSFDEQYWVKLTDIVNGSFIIENVYTHNLDYYNSICTPTPTVTPTMTPTPNPTPNSTPTITPTMTPTPGLSPTPTPTQTPDPTVTPTITPTITETPTNTPTPGLSPTPTMTPTPDPTVTPTITETPTITPTPTMTITPTPSIYYYNVTMYDVNCVAQGSTRIANNNPMNYGSGNYNFYDTGGQLPYPIVEVISKANDGDYATIIYPPGYNSCQDVP